MMKEYRSLFEEDYMNPVEPGKDENKIYDDMVEMKLLSDKILFGGNPDPYKPADDDRRQREMIMQKKDEEFEAALARENLANVEIMLKDLYRRYGVK